MQSERFAFGTFNPGYSVYRYSADFRRTQLTFWIRCCRHMIFVGPRIRIFGGLSPTPSLPRHFLVLWPYLKFSSISAGFVSVRDLVHAWRNTSPDRLFLV